MVNKYSDLITKALFWLMVFVTFAGVSIPEWNLEKILLFLADLGLLIAMFVVIKPRERLAIYLNNKRGRAK